MTNDELPSPPPNQSPAEYRELINAAALVTTQRAKAHIKRGDFPAAQQALKDCILTLRVVIALLPQCRRMQPNSKVSAALSRAAVGPVFAGIAGQSHASTKHAKHRSWNRKLGRGYHSAPSSHSTLSPTDWVLLYNERIEVEHQA